MALFRSAILSLAAAATLVGAASPAAAQRWGWGGPRYYGYHRGGDVGGALVGGLIIGGIVGAVAASNRDRGAGAYRAPSAEDRAADACAGAVEDDRRAPVNRVNSVNWFDEAWHVTGVVNAGDPDGPGNGVPDSFTCTFRYGKVEDIRYGSQYRPG